ncbi:MAG: NUDIX domain-containing protein [Candidatus Dormiibacterota bacterium]
MTERDPRCEPLLATIRSHPAADEREAASIRRLANALERLARPFDRETLPAHATASAIVVGRRGTLLHVHKRLGRWLQPGGHIDPGEEPPAAALRETEEETGLGAWQAEPPHLLHVDAHWAGQHLHLDLRYLLCAGSDDPQPPAGESQQARWFEWEEALAVADVSLAGALRAALRARSPARPQQ